MARADRVKRRQARQRAKEQKKRAKKREKASNKRTRQSNRTKRQEKRQDNRSGRQEKRQDTKKERSKNRTRRQASRQESRSQRQQLRQENRTRRAEGRQAVRKEKVIQKGESGYWSPEGIEARGNRAGQIIGASGQLVGDLTEAGVAIATGGASSALGSMFAGDGESIGQSLGGMFGGDDEQPMNIEPMNEGFDFSFSNPIVIGGAIAGAGLLYMLTRPAKKKKKDEL